MIYTSDRTSYTDDQEERIDLLLTQTLLTQTLGHDQEERIDLHI